MKSWPTKDPDEILDYKVLWAADLGEDTIVQSEFSLVVPAGLVIDSDSHSATDATVWLSGGNDGEIGTILNRITTAGGRVMEQAVLIGVASSVPSPAPSGYVRPTPADLIAKYPAFAAVPPATIQAYLNDAPVDDTWLERDFATAIMLWAAHTMMANGIGADELGIAGAAGLSRLKSGTLDVSFKESSSQGSGEYGGTAYGRQFYALLRANKGGPRVIGGAGYCQSGWAKDVPFWNGVFR